MKVKKILIAGDLLRPRVENGVTYNFHEKRIDKYYDFFKFQLTQATTAEVDKINTNNTDFLPCKMYQLCGIDYLGDEEWLKIYDLKDVPSEAIEYYGNYIKDALVIYIEMPLIFKKIHNQLDIPYIDLTVHPIRFLDDHLLGVATNVKTIFDKMKKYQVDEKLFYLHANSIRAQVDQYQLPIEPNSALIAGQTNVDKALYCDGRCLSIQDYESKILEMGEVYDVVYYKAHPFNRNLSKIYDFLKQFPFVKICPSDWNTYKMLSNPNLKKVYAITSGVLYEAPYFEKNIEFLYKPCFKFDYSKQVEYDEDNYLSIGNEIMNPIFWKDVLSDDVEINVECTQVRYENVPNRIRAAFNDYWSFTEFDPVVRTVSKKYEDRIKRVERDAGTINELNRRIAALETQIGILRNDPAFEKNIFKRVAKKSVYRLAKNSTEWNPKIVLKKLKKENQLLISEEEEINAVKGITYRPHAPHGGRGGGGAVLSAMRAIMASEIGEYPITYNYSERDGIWHTLRNRYFSYHNYERFINPRSTLIPLYAAIVFVREKTKNEHSKLYICHDYATAYGLYLMRKRYVLVVHSQGTRVDERIALGEQMTKQERITIQMCEKEALENAICVCFPSKGAEKIYFESNNNLAERDRVKLGPALYNTIYVDVQPKKIKEVEKDENTLTFLSVGTMTKAKGQDNVCEFFASLLHKETEKKIRWICVGKGPLDEKVNENAVKLMKEHSNFQFIKFDRLKFAEVQYLYTISDVYIMLHRTSIFDLSTLEAMKNSCAIVLSRVGGNLEYDICDNIVFSNENADTIETVLKKDSLLNLKEKNKKVYDNEFSRDKFKERYTNLITNIIKEI
ncbi:MAG: glycosyltransferase [Eubacterium sp.]|nr:glycosyltransferase [Eubacterium sp.]